MTNISAFHIRTAFHMRKMTNIGISDYGGLQNGHLCLKSVHLGPDTGQLLALISNGV